jgi:hypothetical protein
MAPQKTAAAAHKQTLSETKAGPSVGLAGILRESQNLGGAQNLGGPKGPLVYSNRGGTRDLGVKGIDSKGIDKARGFSNHKESPPRGDLHRNSNLLQTNVWTSKMMPNVLQKHGRQLTMHVVLRGLFLLTLNL